jgi:hypothetical protein
MGKKDKDEVQRKTIMVRDIDWNLWQEFRKEAEGRGMKLKYFFEAALRERLKRA